MRRVRGELKGNLSNDTGPLKTGLATGWPLAGLGRRNQNWTGPGLDPLLEPRICLGGIKKMVVWEVSSKGGPHPWNQGFAWEA